MFKLKKDSNGKYRSLELDLDTTLHRRLLHDELRRKPDLVVEEPPWRDEDGPGWLDGHANEIVVPLVRTGTDDRATTPHEGSSGREAALPGGEWLYAKVYSSPQRQREILAERLPALLAVLPPSVDRWFFLRFADPDTHLRLRFHGPAGTVNGPLLTAVHDWAGGLRAEGLIRTLVLDTYEPEVDRYGGPDAIEAAERAFRADSEAVLALLGAGDDEIADEVLVAVNFVDLLRRVRADGEPWWSGDLAAPVHYPGMHRHVRAAVDLLDGVDDDAGAHPSPLRDAWTARGPAVDAYGRCLRDSGASARRRAMAVDGLLHMHHNRLVGIDPELERRAHSVTARVAAAHRGRARARA